MDTEQCRELESHAQTRRVALDAWRYCNDIKYLFEKLKVAVGGYCNTDTCSKWIFGLFVSKRKERIIIFIKCYG